MTQAVCWLCVCVQKWCSDYTALYSVDHHHNIIF